MNTIKLKAFNENNKKIVDVKQITFFEYGDIIVTYEVYSGEQRNMRNPKILRYVGAKDINGVEIYEGDFCRAEFRGRDGITVIQGHIIMDEFMWCIDCTGFIGDDIFSINRPHNFEVIGNIYENPKLLNKQ